MDIITSYVDENSGADIYFDELFKAKKPIIQLLLTNELESFEFDEKAVKDYLKRIFKSISKRYQDKNFIFNEQSIDWKELTSTVLANLAERAKLQVEMLHSKRIRLHAEAHIAADNEIAEIVKDKLFKPHDEVDDFFLEANNQLQLDIMKNLQENWLVTYRHPKEVHKQDILYYNIYDLVSRNHTNGAHVVLGDKYSIFLHHCKAISSISTHQQISSEQESDQASNYVQSVLSKKHRLKTLIKSAKELRRKDGQHNKMQKYCIRAMSLMKNMFANNANLLLDARYNEYENTMQFVYPLLNNLLKYDKNLNIRWGEAKLITKKSEENAALDDNDRRSPGPSIDVIIRIKQYNNLEFVVGEVSGPLSKQDHEHYVGDRNKLAKNMKAMLKHISSLNKSTRSLLTKLKVIGIQTYEMNVYVYSLVNYKDSYVFIKELQFEIPKLKKTIKDKLPGFIMNIFKLKNMILYSKESIIEYIKEEHEVGDGTPSNISSPYVSPQKRKHP